MNDGLNEAIKQQGNWWWWILMMMTKWWWKIIVVEMMWGKTIVVKNNDLWIKDDWCENDEATHDRWMTI